ncbi:hypothetical protein [Corynebacterium sp. A21]|uniref:hypothetical protein n=1 Tax=Corynebacterium sp. A21 TaxID=3457318 RepID=UPI003FD303B0
MSIKEDVMYAVAATWNIANESDNWLAGFEEQVVPFLQTLPGFVGARATRDHDAAVNHTLTIFTDRADAEHLVALDSAPDRQAQWAAAGVTLVGDLAIVEVLYEFDTRTPSQT